MTAFEPSRVRIIRETVYLGTINAIRLGVEEYDDSTDTWTALDLTTAASFVVELVPAPGNAGDAQGPYSTGTYSDMVDASVAGLVVLTLGEISIDAGDYYLRLHAVDVGGDLTQIVHEENPHYRVIVTVAEGS